MSTWIIHLLTHSDFCSPVRYLEFCAKRTFENPSGQIVRPYVSAVKTARGSLFATDFLDIRMNVPADQQMYSEMIMKQNFMDERQVRI